ncbi:hypothetical protein HIM_08744 [Hirsutella minnesotensis 3608]|uniref:Uncharacterized protein n=1 Tax=Hirsutella minnesotensis 3608 TaxID=1043627 RepID=A0A0F8A3I7_9HYPO|nr:hypothetical protein HIM_08744 [Hirsutella minnesotensis 3608]
MKITQALLALGMFAGALAAEQCGDERKVGARGEAAPVRASKEDMAQSPAMPTAAVDMVSILGVAFAAGLAWL